MVEYLVTDKFNGSTKELAAFAEALAVYPHLETSVLAASSGLPTLRVKPKTHPALAEDIICVTDEDQPGAVAFLYSWGEKIPGRGIAEKAAAVAYVLHVDQDVAVETVLGFTANTGEARPSRAEFTLSFSAEARALSLARHLAVGAARLWSLEALADRVSIITSELTTNSVHEVPGMQIWLRVSIKNGGILVEVWDPSPRLPVKPTGIDLEALGGRGLLIVEHLSADSGVRPTLNRPGKVTWALVLPEPEEPGND